MKRARPPHPRRAGHVFWKFTTGALPGAATSLEDAMSDHIGVVSAGVNPGADPGPIPESLLRRMPATPQIVETDLDHLAARIRAGLQGSKLALSNALEHALDVGDTLKEVWKRVPEGDRERWLNENCSLGVSTAHLYVQLANHREKIKDKLRETPDLSLRAARSLIAKKGRQSGHRQRTGKKGVSETPAWAIAFEQSSDAEKTAGLTIDRVKNMFTYMPVAVRDELEDLVLGNAAAKATTERQRNTIRGLMGKAKPVVIDGTATRIN
jgi:hypothetical protein